MGTLEIRRASAQVKGLGTPRMPELETGASAAWAARARAAQAAAEAARVRGHAAINGITARGRIVAQTARQLGDLAMDIFRRENERVASEALVERERWANLEMGGDGTEDHPGRFNERIDDAQAWLRDVGAAFEAHDEELRGGMTPAQRRIFDERARRDDVPWRKRICAHAAKATLDRQVAASDGLLQVRAEKAAAAFAAHDGEELQGALDDWLGELENNCDLKLVPQEARGAVRHKAAFALVSAAEGRAVEKWLAQTAGETDPDAVAREWDGIIGSVEESDGRSLHDHPALQAALGGEGLAADERELLVGRLHAAKAKAVAGAASLRAEGWRKAEAAAREREIGFLSRPIPQDAEGEEAYYRQMGSDYAGLARDLSLPEDARLRYAKTAERLGFNEVAARAGRKAEAGRAEAAAAKEKAKEEAAALKEAQARNFERANTDFDAGFCIGADGSPVELDSREKARRALALFADGRIDRKQWHALRVSEDRSWDAESRQMRAHVLDLARKAVPGALAYREAENRFEPEPQAKARAGDGTGLKFRTANGRKEATYAQLCRALNLANGWRRAHGKSVAEANAYIDRLVEGDLRRQMRANIDEALDEEQNILDDWRSFNAR